MAISGILLYTDKQLRRYTEGYISSVIRYVFQERLSIVINPYLALRLLIFPFVRGIFGLYSVLVKLLSLSVIPGIYVQKQMKFSCTNLKLDITFASDVKQRNATDLHFFKNTS